jgi:hypothetical protein
MGESRATNYRLVIREWCAGKIRRDLRSGRPKPLAVFDANQFVDLTLQLMERVAEHMYTDGTDIQLIRKWRSSRRICFTVSAAASSLLLAGRF